MADDNWAEYPIPWQSFWFLVCVAVVPVAYRGVVPSDPLGELRSDEDYGAGTSGAGHPRGEQRGGKRETRGVIKVGMSVLSHVPHPGKFRLLSLSLSLSLRLLGLDSLGVVHDGVDARLAAGDEAVGAFLEEPADAHAPLGRDAHGFERLQTR